MVPVSGMAGLGVAALMSIAWPVIAYLICRERMALRARNIIVGAVCFIVFALVLEGLLNRFVLVINPTTAAWFNAHKIGIVVYGALAAGIFEETARLFGMSLLARKEEGTGVAYGIGHGGAESILIGALGLVSSIALAVLLNQGKLQSVLAHAPPGTVEKVQTQLVHLTFVTALAGGVERASALVLQIALSLLVWRAVKNKQPLFYIAAIFAHALFDTPAALIQTGFLHLGTWTIEGGYAALAALLLIVLLPRLPARVQA